MMIYYKYFKITFHNSLLFVLVIFCFFVINNNNAQAAIDESTYTSPILDYYHSSVEYGNISWNHDTPVNTSLVFSVRAGEVAAPDGTWTNWSVVTNNTSLSTYDGNRYFQYKVVLGTDDQSVTPTVYDVSIVTNTDQLISSVYDSEASDNIINYISWSETLSGSSDVAFQIRSSADNLTWTNWCGPDDGQDGCDTERWFTDPSGEEEVDDMFTDQVDDQYFQYKVILISGGIDGTDLPVVNSIYFNYGLAELYSLSYSANSGGSIAGDSLQSVYSGTNGTAVTAVPSANYRFVDWSDGVSSNPRTDMNVLSDVSVSANFSVVGGGLAPQAYSPPTSPSTEELDDQSENSNVINDFQIIINNGEETTESRNVKLKLVSGADTDRMSISEDKNFRDVSIVSYVEDYDYELSNGIGMKKVFVRFYTQYGQGTREAIFDSIELVREDDEIVEEESGFVEDGKNSDVKEDNILTSEPKVDDEKYLCEDRSSILYHIVIEAELMNDLDYKNFDNKIIFEKYTKEIISSFYHDEKIKNKITFFISNGTESTQRLGEGERAGVVNSFASAFGRLPASIVDWEDVIRIANSRWPAQLSGNAEKNSTNAFRRVYLRNPDRTNMHDDAAIVIVAYGLRPCRRNIKSEAQAIYVFRSIYGYHPKNALDWDIVRATAYSGSER